MDLQSGLGLLPGYGVVQLEVRLGASSLKVVQAALQLAQLLIRGGRRPTSFYFALVVFVGEKESLCEIARTAHKLVVETQALGLDLGGARRWTG